MQRVLIAVIILYFLSCASKANAVPRFSRQTGLSCSSCHSNPPELTAFGRDFKIHGYVLTDKSLNDEVVKKDLWLSRSVPLSAMIQISDTAFQTEEPKTQNNAVEFPQQLSLLLPLKRPLQHG